MASLNCWSGPRCCSTSLMYAWAQREDTSVLDEPLYASYLKITGHDRPYKDLVGASSIPSCPRDEAKRSFHAMNASAWGLGRFFNPRAPMVPMSSKGSSLVHGKSHCFMRSTWPSRRSPLTTLYSSRMRPVTWSVTERRSQSSCRFIRLALGQNSPAHPSFHHTCDDLMWHPFSSLPLNRPTPTAARERALCSPTELFKSA